MLFFNQTMVIKLYSKRARQPLKKKKKKKAQKHNNPQLPGADRPLEFPLCWPMRLGWCWDSQAPRGARVFGADKELPWHESPVQCRLPASLH